MQDSAAWSSSHLDRSAPALRRAEPVSLEQVLATRSIQFAQSSQLPNGADGFIRDIGSFLALAISLAAVVDEIHQHKITHGAITPASILLATDPTLTDGKARVHILEPALAAKTASPGSVRRLAYVSPEQTGRMNRPVDHRTDLYSLGVVFYQVLTGQLPFSATDPLALVHAHIATRPTPPVQIRSDLPLPLSDIVLRLLAKDPQDRYQSAYGLSQDLEMCQTGWQTTGRIEPFTLGQNDVSDRLLLPPSLYGRRHELDRLIGALDEVCKGATQCLFISGDSGIGKTALVGELVEPAIARGGTLISNRSESHRRTVPYAAAIGALEDFVRQVLAREPDQLSAWRGRLTVALAGNTEQLIRSIPDLGLILEAPSDTAPEASDPKVLLSLALQSFLRTIARPDHPLVVFVDDAQWVDADSLHLLHDLTIQNDLHLLVICAYREDKGLPDYLQQVVSSVPGDRRLALTPLDLASTSHFLTDALHTAPEQVAEVGALIHEKTGGNPLFLREYLRSLHDQSLVTFNLRQRTWEWDLARMRATPITDNVAELVRGRLEHLPEQAQRVLKVAAIMGSQIERDQLAVACQQTLAETDQALQLALDLGTMAPIAQRSYQPAPTSQPSEPRLTAMRRLATEFIFPHSQDSVTTAHDLSQSREAEDRDEAAPQAISPRAYAFAHDQVREAARSLLPALTEESLHGQIGRGLLKSMTPAQRQQHIFMLVRHLNLGPSLTSWPERVELAELNLEAGRQALALVAYDNALSLALAGLELLNRAPLGNAWQDRYALVRDLHVTAAKAASRAGHFEQADRLLEALDQHAASVLDQALATQVRMFSFYLQGRHAEAVTAALHTLRRLGVRLPQRPRTWHLLAALARTQLAVSGRRIESLADLPPMTDERSLKAIEIMAAVSISAASANPGLLALIGLEIVRRTLRHGSSPLSAIGYALYGVLLCGVTGQVDRGYAFGQLALRLAPQMRSKVNRVFVKYFVYAHISHWTEHIKATLQPLRDLATTGEFEYLAVAAALYPYFTWFIGGLDVSANEKSIADNIHLLEPFKDTPLYYRYRLGQQYFQNLLGQSDDPCQMAGQVYDERRLLPLHVRENDRTTIFYLACHKLILCTLFEDYLGAEAAARLAREYSDGGLGTPLVPVLTFYDSLARLARYSSTSTTEARQILKTVAVNQRKMRAWARYSPANCLHRFSLVEAEPARVRGENGRARELYDTAIQQARAHEYLPELPVAHEVAARFYLSIGQPSYADHHLRAAHTAYQTWGALGKLRQLENKYPELFPGAIPDGGTSHATLSAYLDMASVLKAAQVLSSESALPRLTDTLIQILIENAGAQSGYLLLPTGDQWQVVAGRSAAEAGDEVKTAVAMSIVRQVVRTREPLLLNDVAASAPYAQDPHLLAVRPKSILCLPLLDKGELEGVFYMENRLTRDAFPPERLQPLTLLATQAAVSLKNASLVAELQEARDNIQASERRFRLLFENAPLGMFEIDISEDAPQIRAANRRAEATYGWSADEFASLEPAQLIPDESREEIRHLVETVRAGRTALLETTNRRRDGTLFPVRIIATPARDQRGLRMIVAVEDITAQRQRRSEAEAIDEERRRIAQEIHDGVAQDLASLRLKLSLWRDWIGSNPERMQGELDETQNTLDTAIEEIRRSIYSLRPLALGEVGLLPALQHYVADFNEQHEVYVDLHIDIPEARLPTDLELPLFRSVQEALNNIARHAQASLAWVGLDIEGDAAVNLTIRDNGQ